MFFIWPDADQVLLQAQQQGLSGARSLSIILKDYEQEICIILMFWGLFLIISKYLSITKNRYLFGIQLIADSEEGCEQSQATACSTMQEMQRVLSEFDKI